MAIERQFGDGSSEPQQQHAPQQAGITPRAPLSPQEADVGRLDPAPRKPRQITDWASI